MRFDEIDKLLGQDRFESARRLCETALNNGAVSASWRNQLHWRLYRAQSAMCNLDAAGEALRNIQPQDDDESLDVLLRLAEDCHRRARYTFFRDSPEMHQGVAYEEYEKRWENASLTHFRSATRLADTAQRRSRIAESLKRCRQKEAALSLVDEEAVPLPAADEPVAELQAESPQSGGTISGRLRFANGHPVAGSLVTLGFACQVDAPDPSDYIPAGITFSPPIGPQPVLTCVTDSNGAFAFNQIPAGRYAYIAVALDPVKFDVSTRFVAQDIAVSQGERSHFDLRIEDWRSAPAKHAPFPLPTEWVHAGTRYRLIHQEPLRNPFFYDFPRQLIGFDLPANVTADRLVLVSSTAPDQAHPFQISANRLVFFTDLPAVSEKSFGLYTSETASPPIPDSDLKFALEPSGRTGVIDTGRARFRLPAGKADKDASPPLIAVCGDDAVWRGKGRLRLADGVSVLSRDTVVTESGPLLLTLRITYRLSSGGNYSLEFTAHRDEPYLLAHEICPDEKGAFEFSLKEFSGGRGFLHWTPEGENNDALHWSGLTARDRELARLQESVAWWIPPCGFAYAMTGSQVRGGDCIGVFTIRRGDWIDRRFQAITQGPGDEQRELDWPFPEMIGSTISMITAHTTADGDAFFRFGFFDGERRWGILVSTLDRNEGRHKEISAVQHKNSSPRLDDFKQWRLDEPDRMARPFVITERDKLKELRKKKDSPAFASIWEKIRSREAAGAGAGLRFAVDGDPVVAWRKKLELVCVAQIYPRAVLLGRDFSDIYSPVGARPITPWVEEYDLIAASGVFTPDEERLVRRFFMLMGHMYMEPDLMNWKFNSRNANFEADRVDLVGSVGLAFRGNPDADRFIAHAADLMERSINIYCTPGSGKWYENPACYYLHAMKCRMNLAFHLATHGVLDSTRIPRLKDFLRWGVLLLTPPCPHEYELMRDGTDAEGYALAEKVRRIAPVGDHARIGPWVPDHYALMAKLYRKSDPEFADLLLWAWQEGGADGSYYGNLPLVFAGLDEQDLKPSATRIPPLESRRLEGFGAVFRSDFAGADESFLLLKQGPGGYRYHRSEGSIILFAHGKPLVYDGGEAGETWRHSTLSFYDVHTPLAAGHVERFHALPAIGFVQGVHPVVIKPGEPVFQSDSCHHDLVQVAFDRYAEPDPAVIRTVFSAGNQYVVIHDDLHVDSEISSHWNLQVVADRHEHDPSTGYRFFGRFGVDLQVLLPDQSFAAQAVEQVPTVEYHRPPNQCFSMRHLMVTANGPRHYLGILRPLAGEQTPVTASLIHSRNDAVGVQITGTNIDDRLWFSRQAMELTGDEYHFSGRYGAVLIHHNATTLVLLEGTSLQFRGITIDSHGPAVQVSLNRRDAVITAEGNGNVLVHGLASPVRLKVRGTAKVQVSRRDFKMQSV